MRIVLICLTVLFFISSSVLAIETSELNTKKNEVSKVQVDTKTTESTDVDLLKLEIELLTSHNKELINIIIWSLGFVAMFLIAFLGTIGFFNNRRISQDKEGLILLIEKSLLEIKNELEKEYSVIKENHDKLDNELSGKITEKSFSLEGAVDNKIKGTEKGLIIAFNNLIDSREKTILDKIQSIKTSLVKLRSDYEFRDAEHEIRYWEDKGVPGNEITYWFRYCEIASKESCNEWAVGRGLENIMRLLDNGAKIDGMEKADIFKILDKLPKVFLSQSRKVKERLS